MREFHTLGRPPQLTKVSNQANRWSALCERGPAVIGRVGEAYLYKNFQGVMNQHPC
jgi:hypothetical protein